MDQVHDQALNLELHHAHALHVEGRVLLELALELVQKRGQGSPRDGRLSLFGKVNLVREAENLRRESLVVLLGEALDQHAAQARYHVRSQVREPHLHRFVDDDGFLQRDNLPGDGFHRRDAPGALCENHGMNPREEFL